MKNVKVLASIAALATVSCMAAVSASAASSIEFKLDAAKSNATTKVVDVILVSDELTNVSVASFDIELNGEVLDTTSPFKNATFEYWEDGGVWTVMCDHDGNKIDLENGALKVMTLTIAAEEFNAVSNHDYLAINSTEGDEAENWEIGKISVVNAAEAGTFTDGEGVAVKAFTAAASAEGTYTWNVTDGANVATAVATDVTGGADVVIGLTVAGANVGNVSYAAVTID